jgi:hypothetical protein
MDPIISNAQELCRILENDFNRRWQGQPCSFEINPGRKYIKIMQITNTQQHVHCFIDRITGDVYKAASFAVPAKGARYNILNDMEVLHQRADWSGGYLYKR